MPEKSTATKTKPVEETAVPVEEEQVSDALLRQQIELFVQNQRTNLTKHLLKATKRLTDRGISAVDAIAVVRYVYESTKSECEH